MIDLVTLLETLIAVVVIGGAVVGFFTMQKGQNMKIAQLEKDVVDLKIHYEKELLEMKAHHEKELTEMKRKQSLSTRNQIKTEKDLVAINVKLDHILSALEELKKDHKENHND